MYGASQRKGMESHQLLELRNIVKRNGGEVQKDFVKKYRELKVESNRGKQAPCVNTLYAHNQRIRRDSQGRDYYQERKSRYDSRGRPFVRRYFRKNNNRQRSFSRDMRSVSRNRNKSRDGYRQERGRSTGRKNDKKQELSCTGCTCDNCEKLREAAKGVNVNWCEEYKENGENQANVTEMILDLGAPVSVAGNKWIEKYLQDHGLELEKLNTEKCYQKLTFGPSKQYISNLKIELPVLVRDLHRKEDTLKVPTYVVEANVPFLCGKSELKDEWRAKINTESNILEVKTDGQRKKFKMIGTRGNHVALKIEKRDLEGCKDNKNCYICDQCSNQYENKADLENHKERRHTKEYDEKWGNKDEGKQQKREENRNEMVCNLCEEKFENKSEVKEHWETDHESPVDVFIRNVKTDTRVRKSGENI